MPGMENFAPDRTETRRGFDGSPNRRPIFISTVDKADSTCFHSPGGNRPVLWKQVESALRSEEHTSELQSRPHLVCRLLLEKKKIKLSYTLVIAIKKMIEIYYEVDEL